MNRWAINTPSALRTNTEMSLPRIYLIAILLLAFGIGASGQEPLVAVLVDEFDRIPCDDFRGRIDTLLSELRENPSSFGLVVNSGRDWKKVEAVMREEMIKSHLLFRRFDGTRLKFIRTSEDGLKTQFWRLPSGNASGIQLEIDNSFALPTLVQPRILFTDYDFDDLCPPIDYKKLFGMFLENNPNARGNIVVRDFTLRESRKRRSEILKYLVKERKIDSKRIRTFFSAPTKPRGQFQPVVEYWYIP